MERFTRESLLTHITPFLTQHDLGITAQVCSNWKHISYSPFLYLQVSFPLLNKNDVVEVVDPWGRKAYAECFKLKLYSVTPPPVYIDENGKKPFEDILQIMLVTKKRFELTRLVDFKNFMFSDEALDMAVKIFPRLQKLVIDGDRMTEEGLSVLQHLKHLKFLVIFLNRRVLRKENKKDKEEKFKLKLSDSCEIVWGYKKLEDNFKLCNKCGAYYNMNKNGPKSCLFHPQDILDMATVVLVFNVVVAIHLVILEVLAAHMDITPMLKKARIMVFTAKIGYLSSLKYLIAKPRYPITRLLDVDNK